MIWAKTFSLKTIDIISINMLLFAKLCGGSMASTFLGIALIMTISIFYILKDGPYSF